jgi:hypothetical protein
VQVALPSGATAELRTALKAKDKFAVQAVISSVNADNPGGGVVSLMETALMARLIDEWSLEAELPGRHACEECTGNSVTWHEHVRDAFGEALDLDDFNELEKQVAPLLAKVMTAPNLETPSGSAASS